VAPALLAPRFTVTATVTKRERGRAAVALAIVLGSTGSVASNARAATRPHAVTHARAAAPGRPESAGTCSKLPAGKRVVKLNLKPETEVADLVAWISSITCRQFLLPDVPASHAKVTIVAPSLITASEAYQLFLEALDSVGLTVYPSGRFLRIIETAKAKTYPIPVVDPDDHG
jgi:general secretion pathway protein D